MLTVGIPTFNRASEAVDRVTELSRLDLRALGVDVLVSDNASDDDTQERVLALTNANVRYVRNDHNLGFSGNLVRLFDEAETEYLMLLSDEDSVAEAGLAAVRSFLEERTADFVSPIFYLRTGSKVYRGRAGVPRRIGPRDFRAASFYISGIVFRVSTARPILRELQARLNGDSMWEVYPQVLLTLRILLNGGIGYWHGSPVASKTSQLKTTIADPKHGAYTTMHARWEQACSTRKFLLNQLADAGRETQRGRTAQRLLNEHERTLVANGIQLLFSDLERRDGLSSALRWQRWLFRPFILTQRVLRDPAAVPKRLLQMARIPRYSDPAPHGRKLP